MGVSLAVAGDEVLAGAPRWTIEYDDNNDTFVRGRVSVFNENNSINYEAVPCEKGKTDYMIYD